MSDQFENDGPYQDAVSAEEIERRIMDSAFPKTSMEWWASREIKELRDRLSDLEANIIRLKKLLKETLAIAERNELGDYQSRASAALKGEK